MKAKAEALAFSVSEKDAEIELLHDRQERQHTQVCSGVASAHYKLYTGTYMKYWYPLCGLAPYWNIFTLTLVHPAYSV